MRLRLCFQTEKERVPISMLTLSVSLEQCFELQRSLINPGHSQVTLSQVSMLLKEYRISHIAGADPALNLTDAKTDIDTEHLRRGLGFPRFF